MSPLRLPRYPSRLQGQRSISLPPTRTRRTRSIGVAMNRLEWGRQEVENPGEPRQEEDGEYPGGLLPPAGLPRPQDQEDWQQPDKRGAERQDQGQTRR